jgi:hypothetical protein
VAQKEQVATAMSESAYRFLRYTGSAFAAMYAVALARQAIHALGVVIHFYQIDPGLLFAFPVVNGQVDYTGGPLTALLFFVFFGTISIGLVCWAFPKFRLKHPKLAIAVCVLTVFAFPVGSAVGVVMAAVLVAEGKRHKSALPGISAA